VKCFVLACSLALASLGASAQSAHRGIALADLKSGTTFMSADLRSLQADDGLNPASLWWLQGERLWQQAGPNGPACASCHGDAATRMVGVAARYPRRASDGVVKTWRLRSTHAEPATRKPRPGLMNPRPCWP